MSAQRGLGALKWVAALGLSAALAMFATQTAEARGGHGGGGHGGGHSGHSVGHHGGFHSHGSRGFGHSHVSHGRGLAHRGYGRSHRGSYASHGRRGNGSQSGFNGMNRSGRGSNHGYAHHRRGMNGHRRFAGGNGIGINSGTSPGGLGAGPTTNQFKRPWQNGTAGPATTATPVTTPASGTVKKS